MPVTDLFVRVLTPAGNAQSKLTVTARFDDRDITHILTENLEVQGTPWRSRLDNTIVPELTAGSPSQTTLVSTGVGDLPVGTYTYRMSFVERDGGGNVTLRKFLLQSLLIRCLSLAIQQPAVPFG